MNAFFAAIRSLRRADHSRAGLPGEHWATFGAAAALFQQARHTRSPLLRLVVLAGCGLLVARALGGRDGLLARARARSAGRRSLRLP